MDRIASYMGEADGLDADDATLANAKVNLCVRLGWSHFFHPDTMTVEKRRFRPSYDATAAVSAGDERWFGYTEQYYQSLQDQAAPGTGETTQPPALLVDGEWVENSAYWAVCATSYGTEEAATVEAGSDSGSCGVSLVKGSVSLAADAESGTISGLALGTTTYAVMLRVRIPAGGSKFDAYVVDGTLTEDGFDYELSAMVPSSGYTLDYVVMLG